MRSNSKEAVAERRQAWTLRLRGELNRMLELLKTRTDIEKVILFGSIARGEGRYHSDLDLVIIQKTEQPFLDRLRDFYLYLKPGMATDLLVYTPEEWDTLVTTRRFVNRINREGVTLWNSRQGV
jgi:predicted nucleotidyltransferase